MSLISLIYAYLKVFLQNFGGWFNAKLACILCILNFLTGKTTAQVCKMEPVVGKASAFACNVSSKPSEVIFDTVDTLHADGGQISMVDKHIGMMKIYCILNLLSSMLLLTNIIKYVMSVSIDSQ